MHEILDRYFSGDTESELLMVELLRQLGETYARRRGMKGFDVDAAGVDFAAYILIERADDLRDFLGNKAYYLRRAARWFMANLARNQQLNRTVPLMIESEHHEWTVLAEAEDRLISPSAEEALLEELAWDEVDRLVKGFPEKDQQLYQLCFKDGLNCQEAADELGWRAAAARKRMERLRGRLKTALEASNGQQTRTYRPRPFTPPSGETGHPPVN